MQEDPAFVLCIENNAIRDQALLLIESIRAFAGRYSGVDNARRLAFGLNSILLRFRRRAVDAGGAGRRRDRPMFHEQRTYRCAAANGPFGPRSEGVYLQGTVA